MKKIKEVKKILDKYGLDSTYDDHKGIGYAFCLKDIEHLNFWGLFDELDSTCSYELEPSRDCMYLVVSDLDETIEEDECLSDLFYHTSTDDTGNVDIYDLLKGLGIEKPKKDASVKKGFSKFFNNEDFGEVRYMDYKPQQYQIGIDTFDRAKANCTKEEVIGFCKLNVDKYIWRKKGSDIEDLYKAKDYIDLWINTLKNE